jgi:hypothetical protein
MERVSCVVFAAYGVFSRVFTFFPRASGLIFASYEKTAGIFFCEGIAIAVMVPHKLARLAALRAKMWRMHKTAPPKVAATVVALPWAVLLDAFSFVSMPRYTRNMVRHATLAVSP